VRKRESEKARKWESQNAGRRVRERGSEAVESKGKRGRVGREQ